MPDYQYFKNRKECTEKILNRIKIAEKGTSFLAAELHWIAVQHGYGAKYVSNILSPMVDFGQIRIAYRDGKAYEIVKL